MARRSSDAEALARKCREAQPAIEEVEVVHGGQPHYRYLDRGGVMRRPDPPIDARDAVDPAAARARRPCDPRPRCRSDRPRRAAATRRSASPAWRPRRTLRRAGLRLGLQTVRDLLFHLPRRYDDLRELRTLGELATWRTGSSSVPGPGRRPARRADLPAPGPADRSRALRGRDGRGRGHLVRAALHRAPAARRRRDRRVAASSSDAAGC